MEKDPKTTKKPDETPEKSEQSQTTHEELAAAAIEELIAEQSRAEGAGKKGPPDWFRKAFEST